MAPPGGSDEMDEMKCHIAADRKIGAKLCKLDETKEKSV